MSSRKLVDYSFSSDENEIDGARGIQGELCSSPTPAHLIYDTEPHSTISSSIKANCLSNVPDGEEIISGTVAVPQCDPHRELPPKSRSLLFATSEADGHRNLRIPASSLDPPIPSSPAIPN